MDTHKSVWYKQVTCPAGNTRQSVRDLLQGSNAASLNSLLMRNMITIMMRIMMRNMMTKYDDKYDDNYDENYYENYVENFYQNNN